MKSISGNKPKDNLQTNALTCCPLGRGYCLLTEVQTEKLKLVRKTIARQNRRIQKARIDSIPRIFPFKLINQFETILGVPQYDLAAAQLDKSPDDFWGVVEAVL